MNAVFPNDAATRRGDEMKTLKLSTNVVVDRLKEAAETLKRLPASGLKPSGYVSSWPPFIRDYWDAYGYDKPKTRLGPPSPEAISRMDETLRWLKWLEPDETKLVWAIASGINRKAIGSSMGVHRTTIWREWKAVIRKLTAIINLQKNQSTTK